MHPHCIFASLLSTLLKKQKNLPAHSGNGDASLQMRLRAAKMPGKWYVPEPQRAANLPARPQPAGGQVPRAQSSKKGTDTAAAACMVQPSALLARDAQLLMPGQPRPDPAPRGPGSPGPPPPSPGRCCGDRGAAASTAALPQCCIVLRGRFRWRGERASAALGGWL